MPDTVPPAGNDTAMAVAEPPVLLARPEPGIALLTLNRPERRNSLSLSMIEALLATLNEAGSDTATAAIVLAASGPVFCSGHDLKELTAHRADADQGRAFFAHTLERCSLLMQEIAACPRPVIAAVQGTATAAGCQLVAACDLAVAADTAKFCTPGVNIGLFCSTPMVALSRNVSRKHALEMLLLGEMLSADQAAAWGLVNRSVAPHQVLEEALAWARAIATKPRYTVALGKKAFYAQIEKPAAEAYKLASEVMVENMMAGDAKEGIAAFLDKRPPQWTCC